MRVIISETPAKMFDVLDCVIFDDPSMNFLLITPPDKRASELERRKRSQVQLARLVVDDMLSGNRTTDSGFIYLEESVNRLRAWDNSQAIYLRLRLSSNNEIVTDVEIFPRQVGYGVGESSPDPDMAIAWLLAMPSSVEPGELEPCDDLVQSEFMVTMPGLS